MPATPRALADRYWDQLLELHPLLATQVGEPRFDDRLPDPSPRGQSERERVHRSAMRELEGFDRAALDLEDRATLDLVETFAANDLAALALGYDRLEVVDHLWGPGTLLPNLGSLQRADDPDGQEAFLRRLRAIPGYLEAVAEVMRQGVATGVTAAGPVADRLVAQVKRVLDRGPDDCPALAAIPEDDATGRGRAAAVIRDDVLPAYEAHLATLGEYRPHAREGFGVGSLPGGDELYASRILAFTTLPLTAREIHDLGTSELAQIQEEKAGIARSLGARDAEAAVAGRREAGEDSFASREEIVSTAMDQARRSWDAAPAFFGRLPLRNCEVRPIERSQEADQPEHYIPATADGSRPGIYYVNTSNPTARPRHALATTSYHEANPGHHFQCSVEQEASGRAAIRRFSADLIGMAFCEGWGLYAERLADEMGLYRDDYERLGMLEMQAFRAARLVVDTGIHAFGWERDRAIRTLESAGVPPDVAEREADRYAAVPGQALCYKIGQHEIERWRAAAAPRPEFSLRDFHDRLLSLGSLPLPTLRREMEAE